MTAPYFEFTTETVNVLEQEIYMTWVAFWRNHLDHGVAVRLKSREKEIDEQATAVIQKAHEGPNIVIKKSK